MCSEEDGKPGRQKAPWAREVPLAYAVRFCARVAKVTSGTLTFLGGFSKKTSAPLSGDGVFGGAGALLLAVFPWRRPASAKSWPWDSTLGFWVCSDGGKREGCQRRRAVRSSCQCWQRSCGSLLLCCQRRQRRVGFQAAVWDGERSAEQPGW